MITASNREIQALLLLDSISGNKPWVSTNVGCVSELEEGIISTNSAKALASNLFKILQDSRLRDRLGKAGSTQWSAEFSTAMVSNR